MKKKLSIVFSLLLCTVISAGCYLLIPGDNPCLVTDIRVQNGRQGEQRIASLLVALVNRGEVSLVSLRAEFDVYDTLGNVQPGVGTNHVETQCVLNLVPGEEGEIRVLLDPLFSSHPGEALTITRFCILRIDFSDGTRWTDPGRFYQIMSQDVAVEEL